jgi:hypothetical protein
MSGFQQLGYQQNLNFREDKYPTINSSCSRLFVAHLFTASFATDIPKSSHLTTTIMIATLGSQTNNLKPGAVLRVTRVKTKSEAQNEVANFLAQQQRQDLGYICISKNYFMIYAKPTLTPALFTNLSI